MNKPLGHGSPKMRNRIRSFPCKSPTNSVSHPQARGIHEGRYEPLTYCTLIRLQREDLKLGLSDSIYGDTNNSPQGFEGGRKPVMTYASPVFAHARPDIVYGLQIVQNKFCRRAADAPWHIKNSVLHRDLEP
ncbi:hypothetical protein EVAR_7101_1 [Eumeta japonica]|uniref:Uncharacterized protein n=1 Tax=Eumeta variegata TaxID=151549 RepID=A0A4C1Y863_EUMVA|nr:hypothetical protein EVAR_7101_1 [Eumeta japonica]